MKTQPENVRNYNFPIIETHCHLDYLKAQPLDAILNQARAVSVERVITISVDPDNLDTVASLAKQHDMVYGTQGIHPHEAKTYHADVEQCIRHHIEHDKIVAIGEIGLDYFYSHSDRVQQRKVFENQLQIAVDHAMPVVIHTRNADDDTRTILQNFASQMPCKGVIHSFTSGHALAEYCLSEGFALGVNGIVTFKNANQVREVVAMAPLSQLLLETDAPFLTPVPYRGHENAPYYLPLVAEKIAQVKSVSTESVLQQCYRNSLDIFFG